MRLLKRLRDVEKRMTVKQIVLLAIQEARRYSSFRAHGQALLGKRIAPENTLCGRIEAAVLTGAIGKSEQARYQLIRDAQREGLFLARLALECNARTVAAGREWALESALLITFQALCLQNHDVTSSATLLSMSCWFHTQLADHLLAVRLIELEYFDGTRVLYGEEEGDLLVRIRETEDVIKWVRSLIRERATGPAVPPRRRKPANPHRLSHTPSKGARHLARDIVLSVRIRVHYDFKEFSAAERLIDERWTAEVAQMSQGRKCEGESPRISASLG